MSDVDLRRLRYFLAVAEELNLGRAAARLHLAQPALSRQMTALEGDLGVKLFDRSQRGTTLTSAGELLVDEARALLMTAEALQSRTREVGADRHRFRVGFLPGVHLSATVRRFGQVFPEARAEAVQVSCATQAQALHDGRVDVLIGRLPLDRRALTVVPLYSEPRVLAMPDTHVLAARPELAVDDLVPYDMIQDVDSVPEWRDAVAEKRPLALTLGRRDLPAIGSLEETFEHVAAGYGMAVIPESSALFYTRPGVIYRRVEGLLPGEVVLAMPSNRSTPELEAFVEIAQRTLVRPPLRSSIDADHVAADAAPSLGEADARQLRELVEEPVLEFD